jgi:hypothetical protein
MRDVCAAFFFYQYEAIKDIARMERDFAHMTPKQLQMIKFDYHSERIQRLKECTRLNQYFLNMVVQD